VKNNVKCGHKIPENLDGDLTKLNKYFVVQIPRIARVYPSCRHVIAISIVVMYIDNNGLMTKCVLVKLLQEWFDDTKQAENEMLSEVKFEWFLGVWYTYNHFTGSVVVDQESTIDRLLSKITVYASRLHRDDW